VPARPLDGRQDRARTPPPGRAPRHGEKAVSASRRPPRNDRPRVVVVAKRTAYRRFIEEERDPRAKLLLRRRDPSVKNWVAAHREHMETIDTVLASLEHA